MSFTQEQMKSLMDQVHNDEQRLRKEGQKEYSHDPQNALANFERVSEQTGVSREQVLSVLILKHIDGIMAWIKGHRSQRESVRGRILDARVYLLLLMAMVDDEEEKAKCPHGIECTNTDCHEHFPIAAAARARIGDSS